MTLKGWVVHKVNRLFTRVDLPPRMRVEPAPRLSPLGRAAAGGKREPGTRAVESPSPVQRSPHLGSYAPLIEAIREELTHFIEGHVRMHTTIAERDRYLLTSIEVACAEDPQARELLQEFLREFKPKQIKHYLTTEVIDRLPNASAIDMTQFRGLSAAPDEHDATAVKEAYGELLAELRRTEPRAGARPYQVTLTGRWSELDTASAGAKDKQGGPAAPRTPLAGQTLVVEIDDANGSTRHITLTSVVPGRRFIVGSGENCDIVVNGKYSSRRHCEIWLATGAWWVTDSGSTNGVRVESAGRVIGRSGANAGAADAQAVIEVVAGAHIVLSGVARGEPFEYPRLRLRPAGDLSMQATPMAPPAAAPTTPATPIAVPRRRPAGLMLTVRMASGERTVELPAASLPFAIGRSRSQGLVIDWAHEGVSGHHLDIVEQDDVGALVVVHGDNGVTVDGVPHGPGTQFRWIAGESITLGDAAGRAPPCTLTLSRRS